MDIKDLIFYINKFKAECEKLKPINDDKISTFLCEKDFEEIYKANFPEKVSSMITAKGPSGEDMVKLFIINEYDYIVQPYNPEDPNDFLNVNEVFYYMNGHFGEDTVYAENERIIQNIID